MRVGVQAIDALDFLLPLDGGMGDGRVCCSRVKAYRALLAPTMWCSWASLLPWRVIVDIVDLHSRIMFFG